MTPLASLLLAIAIFAPMYDVPVDVAMEVCYLESSLDPNAIGDNGQAVGAWQFHPSSWEQVAAEMVEDGIWKEAPGLEARTDPWMATHMAMYAIGQRNRGHWWSTFELAEENVR